MYDTQLCNDAYTTVQSVIAHLKLDDIYVKAKCSFSIAYKLYQL